MFDEIAIQQTLNRYSEASSRADWDEALSTFVSDGVWEVPVFSARFQGDAEIRAGLEHFSGPMAYIVQANAPAVITIDGDTATARSVIRESGKFADRDEALEILGSYQDDLVRTADGWQFARRVFVLAGMHSFPLSPAVSSAS